MKIKWDEILIYVLAALVGIFSLWLTFGVMFSGGIEQAINAFLQGNKLMFYLGILRILGCGIGFFPFLIFYVIVAYLER